MNRYLTIQQAAEMLSISTDTIRRMLPELGAVDLAGGKGGKRLIRIPETALNQYLRECEILPPMKIERMRAQKPFYIERRKA